MAMEEENENSKVNGRGASSKKVKGEQSDIPLASSRKSRTLVRRGQGGSWKLLFSDPIEGYAADKPFIHKTLLSILRQRYDLDEKSHFKLSCVREGVIWICHVVKSDQGVDVHELIASLPPNFVLD